MPRIPQYLANPLRVFRPAFSNVAHYEWVCECEKKRALFTALIPQQTRRGAATLHAYAHHRLCERRKVLWFGYLVLELHFSRNVYNSIVCALWDSSDFVANLNVKINVLKKSQTARLAKSRRVGRRKAVCSWWEDTCGEYFGPDGVRDWSFKGPVWLLWN